MRLRFTKMQGAGNDFVVLDATRQALNLSREQLRRLGDRRFGVGADQILIVERSDRPDVDFRYRIFNNSGDEVEQCGNGARCFVRYVHDHGLTDKPVVTVQTLNRVLTLRLQDNGGVSVDMGVPEFALDQIPFDATGLTARSCNGFELWPLEVDGVQVELAVVSMGNPHAVLRVDDVDLAPVETLGPALEAHARFARKVNVGFLQVLARDSVRLRVYERDAGETLACGSGACAAVVAGIRLGWLDCRVGIQARGGMLEIAWPSLNESVVMTGPAQTVFEGEIAW